MHTNSRIKKNIGEMQLFVLCIFLMLIGIICLYNRYPRIEFELSSTNSEEAVQVYYLDKNMNEFDGEHMVWDVIVSKTQRYSFHIPNTNVVRIDFGTSAGINKISNVVFKTIFTVKEIPVQLIETSSFSKDVGTVNVEEDVLLVESIGLDSYVIVNFGEIQKKINLHDICILFSILLIMIMIAVIIVRYDNEIEKFLNITKMHAVIISCILFFITKILFLSTHIGYFAIDEFHHISTLNPNYISNYDMGLFVNYMVKFVCTLFGQNDWVIKIVPFIMGTVSFLCGLYLLYNIYDNPYWIITISAVLIFMPYILSNHFYIRMYVFLEAIVMLDCVLLYNAGKNRGKKREKLYLLFAVIITLFYGLKTKEVSGHALLLLMLAAGLYYLYDLYKGKIENNNNKDSSGKKILICSCVCIAVLLIIALKYHLIGSLVTLVIQGGHASRYIASEPVFLKFIFMKIFYVSIPFIISFVYVWKKRIADKKILFILAGLPLLGYIVIFYGSYYLRSYVAFLPIMCIMAYFAFDKIKISRLQHLAIIFCVITLTINVEDNFWKRPRIPNELAFANLGGAVALAKDYGNQGYEIVTVLTSEKQLAYFNLLDVDKNLNVEDTKKRIWLESNPGEKYGEEQYSNSELSSEAIRLIDEEIKLMFDSDAQKVLITDEAGTGVFWSIYEEEWKDKCNVKRFGENANVIIIN